MSVSNIKIGAIVVGWITSLFLLSATVIVAIGMMLVLGVDFESISQKTSQFTTTSFNLLIYFSIFACYFIGGYVAGRMSAYSGILNGFMVIILNLIAIILSYIFVVIVGDKLNVDIISSILQLLDPYKSSIFILTIMAIIGSIIGGRFGEGYVDRLDQSLGITAPSARTKKNISMMKTSLRQLITNRPENVDDSETSSDKQVS